VCAFNLDWACPPKAPSLLLMIFRWGSQRVGNVPARAIWRRCALFSLLQLTRMSLASAFAVHGFGVAGLQTKTSALLAPPRTRAGTVQGLMRSTGRGRGVVQLTDEATYAPRSVLAIGRTNREGSTCGGICLVSYACVSC
jgi:hypothetical protein